MAAQQPLNAAPGQQYMQNVALDADVQANLCCPSAISAGLSCICFCSWFGAFKTIDQNQHAAVFVWGEYVGSVTQPGLIIVNPIGTELKLISTAKQTMDIKELKVVDAKGNPIMISGNLAYRVYSVKKARVDVQDANLYVYQQAPMVLRKVVSRYTYDTLRSDHGSEVENALRALLQESVADAGVEVLKFDLTDLSYAPEIAQAMLVKQQADAMVEARRLISQAAVSIACDASAAVKLRGHELSPAGEEKLITNLLTVICSHTGVTPTTAL